MRILFPEGEQGRFINEILQKISVVEAAKLCNVSDRTIRDWRREKFLLQKSAMELLCSKTGIPLPKNFKENDEYWYIHKGARMGALASLKKYGRVGGDQAYQKKKWYEWWNAKGKHQKHGYITEPLSIRKPGFSKNLAEFTGIMLGDGGMSKGQVIVSTNSVDDREYGFFVKELMENLFGTKAAVYYPKNARVMNIVISRKKLVEFCNKKLGLHIGHKLKQGLDIPGWIRGNIEFEKKCVRGLMDTDGCIFKETHKIKDKLYSYNRLSLVSASPMLRKSVFDILNNLNLKPKIRSARSVQIEDKEKIKEYFKVIGSSNPKHLNKYYN